MTMKSYEDDWGDDQIITPERVLNRRLRWFERLYGLCVWHWVSLATVLSVVFLNRTTGDWLLKSVVVLIIFAATRKLAKKGQSFAAEEIENAEWELQYFHYTVVENAEVLHTSTQMEIVVRGFSRSGNFITYTLYPPSEDSVLLIEPDEGAVINVQEYEDGFE